MYEKITQIFPEIKVANLQENYYIYNTDNSTVYLKRKMKKNYNFNTLENGFKTF